MRKSASVFVILFRICQCAMHEYSPDEDEYYEDDFEQPTESIRVLRVVGNVLRLTGV